MKEDEQTKSDDREVLKLTKWELANLHLPPVTTVTLYEGEAPLDFLRQRLAMMLEKNPWLTSRIIKQSTDDGVIALAYERQFELEDAIDQHFTVYAPGEINLSLSMPYAELVASLSLTQCARAKPATDADEPLFKVTVIPLAADAGAQGGATPLQQAITLPGFALVVSMNHTLGDGHTYYSLYGMLSAEADVAALNPVRVAGFEKAKSKVIGDKENALFTSAGVAFGIMGAYLGAKLSRRAPQNVCMHAVDPDWVAQEKAKAKQEGQVPFVSTNDVISSWFFREMSADMNIMLANFRSRQPAVLELNETHAGNYEANVPYFQGDVESPALIRQSIRDAEGGFRARRAGSPPTEIPTFSTLVRNKTALITNWATFYRDVILHGDPEGNAPRENRPKLHFPIMEIDGIITSVWNNGIIFSPREGELAILMITRQFDSDALMQRKAQDSQNVPVGARIV
jgi:hypothetical protein